MALPFIFGAISRLVGTRSMAQIVAPKIRSVVRTSGVKTAAGKSLISRMTRLQAEAEVRGFSSPFSEEFAMEIGNSKSTSIANMLKSTQRDIRARGVAGDLADFNSLVLAGKQTIGSARVAVNDAALARVRQGVLDWRSGLAKGPVISPAEEESMKKGLKAISSDQDKLLDAIASGQAPEGATRDEYIELVRSDTRSLDNVRSPNYVGKRKPVITIGGSGKDATARANLLTSIRNSPVSASSAASAILIEHVLALSPTNLALWMKNEESSINAFFASVGYDVGRASIVEIMDSLAKYNGLDPWRRNPAYYDDPDHAADPQYEMENYINLFSNGVPVKGTFHLTNADASKFEDYLNKSSGSKKSLFSGVTARMKPKMVRM